MQKQIVDIMVQYSEIDYIQLPSMGDKKHSINAVVRIPPQIAYRSLSDRVNEEL